LRPLRQPNGIWSCAVCGAVLEPNRLSPFWPVLAGLIGLASLGLSVMSKPQPVPMQPSTGLYPTRGVGGDSVQHLQGAIDSPRLLQQLALADRQWAPRAEPLPSGGVRYSYRKRPGDPDLSLTQIKALMTNPPRFEREQGVIETLLQQLRARGVQLSLSPPRKPGAAGEWDPSARALRIKPEVVRKGSAEFAKVLNHETIHVAQSCRGGGIQARPRLLGLAQHLTPALERVLRDPVYHRVSDWERALEREAYANQVHLELGPALLEAHC